MKSFFVSVAILSTGLMTAQASASEFEATGSIHVKTNVQYASALKNGKTWEDTEYLGGGKTLIITEIALDKLPVTFTLIARDKPEYAPIEITAERSDFRKKRKGRTFSWVFKKTVKFKKGKKKAAPPATKPAPEKEPAKPSKTPEDDDEL